MLLPRTLVASRFLDSEHHWALQLIQGLILVRESVELPECFKLSSALLAEIALAIKHCNIECISVNDQTITKANFAKMSHIGPLVACWTY